MDWTSIEQKWNEMVQRMQASSIPSEPRKDGPSGRADKATHAPSGKNVDTVARGNRAIV